MASRSLVSGPNNQQVVFADRSTHEAAVTDWSASDAEMSRKRWHEPIFVVAVIKFALAGVFLFTGAVLWGVQDLLCSALGHTENDFQGCWAVATANDVELLLQLEAA
jgi:hypothetical protein